MPDRVAGDVSRGEVGLHRVHVAVGAAVRLEFGEVSVPALQRAAFGVGPEVLVNGGRGGRQGGISTGNSGGHRAGGRQQDVRMSVVRLGGIDDVPGWVEAGKPAAVLAVGIAADEGAEPGCRQGIRAGHAIQVRQCEYVGHARVDVQRARLRHVDFAVGAKPPETAVGQRGRPPELDQPAGFGAAPFAVPGSLMVVLPGQVTREAARPILSGSAGPGERSCVAAVRAGPRCAGAAFPRRCARARPGPDPGP